MWPEYAYGGSTMSGFPVGILTIKTAHALLPGNVQHAQSFPAPVLYREIAVSNAHALMRGDTSLLQPIISAARFLEEQGVRAIAGACGSFAYYQMAVANAVNIPVFLSIMTQVPFIQQSLGSNKKLCIVCAAEFTMNTRVFEQCGINTISNLAICEMRGCSEFERMLAGQEPIDAGKLCDEVLAVCTEATQRDRAIAAFLLQCSDLPPFGSDIQRATGLPVFDMTLLIRWLQSATDYLPYSGIYRRRPRPSINSQP